MKGGKKLKHKNKTMVLFSVMVVQVRGGGACLHLGQSSALCLTRAQVWRKEGSKLFRPERGFRRDGTRS